MVTADDDKEDNSDLMMAVNTVYHNNNDSRLLSFPGDIQYEENSGQNSPHQEKIKKESWPRGAAFMAASWAFTLSLHSLLYLPVSILHHGGLVFLLMYIFLLVVT